MAGKGNILKTTIQIAGELSPTLGKVLEKVEKKFSGTAGKWKLAGATAAAGVALVGTAAVKATAKLAEMGDKYNQTVNQMSNSTGLVGAELERLQKAADNVYKANFGENYEDAADAAAQAYKTTGLLGKQLEDVTKGAISLRDTFGYDVNETMRAAKAMMDNFGVSGDKALSMIAAGAQNGLDYSGELIDSISEYSVQFAKIGMDADAMFQVFQSGADSGAWNLDKVGDAVKEFSIRSIDGSKTTIEAFNALGFNADEAMQVFASGGEDAKRAFKIVSKALVSIQDPVKRDAIGVQLFGTMFEDLGVEAIAAMANAQDGIYDTKKALNGINATRMDSLQAVLDGIKRSMETKVLQYASRIASKLQELAPVAQAMADKVGPIIDRLGSGLENMVGWVVDFVQKVADGQTVFDTFLEKTGRMGPIIIGLVGALAAYKAITVALSAAQKVKNVLDTAQLLLTKKLTISQTALGAAMMAVNWPLLLIVAGIAAAIAFGVALYKNWDKLKEGAAKLGEKINEIWSKIDGAVTGFIDNIGAKFPILGGYLSGIWESVRAVWDNIRGVFSNIIGFIDNVFAGNWSAAWDNIVGIFSNLFGGLVNMAKTPIRGVVGAINTVIDSINGVGFTIPEWVPVVGGKAFSIDIPKIPTFATGGFTEGVSIAGEAGTEAVISFQKAYRNQNISYWARAGRMLGATADDYTLYGGGGGGGSHIDLSGISFAPNITVYGGTKEEILEALREAEGEFRDFLLDLLDEWRRGGYDPEPIAG